MIQPQRESCVELLCRSDTGNVCNKKLLQEKTSSFFSCLDLVSSGLTFKVFGYENYQNMMGVWERQTDVRIKIT